MLSNQSLITVLLPAMIAGLLALLINWRIHRDMDGVGWWAAGVAITVLGGILLIADAVVPQIVAVVLGSFLIVGGQYVVVYGLCLFAGTPMLTRTSIIVLAAMAGGMAYFTVITPYVAGRATVFTAALASTFLMQIPALLHIGRKEGLTGVIVLAAVYAISLTILIARVASMIIFGELPELDFTLATLDKPAQLHQIGVFIYSTSLSILRAYGYILLSTNRVQLRLRQTATVDDLTGLPNRRAFEEEMRRILPRVRREDITFGLAVMDIDHFKRINDTYGHAVGDAMLRHFAVAVRKVLRDSDFFARTGGEEFVLVATETSATALRQAAERIRHALEETPMDMPSGPLRATISAGLSISQSGETDYQPVYSRADAALYRAKAGGRNRIEPSA